MKSVNCWLIKDPVPTLIDCGELTENSWDQLGLQLKAQKLKISDIKKIIITHAHVDHIGMANRIVEHSKAKVWMSEYAYDWGPNVKQLWDQRRELLANTFSSYIPKDSPIRSFFDQVLPFFAKMRDMWEPIPTESIVKFNSADGITIGGELWEAIYTPGHASTQTVFFHRKSRHMFSADMLLKLAPTPVVEMDPSNSTKRQKGLPNLLNSFRKMRSLDILKAYPGHYEAFEQVNDTIDLQLWRIEQRLDQTQQYIKAGQNTYDALLQEMYTNRLSFPAAVMMIGYLDELEERERILKKKNDAGIFFFESI